MTRRKQPDVSVHANLSVEDMKAYMKYRYLTPMNIIRFKRVISGTLHMNRHAVWLTVAVLLVAVHSMPAWAQSKDAEAKAAPAQVFQDWKLQCEAKAKRCYIFQRTDLQTSGQQVLNVVVGNLGPDGTHIMHFTVPLGIYIPPGIAMKIDDGDQINVPVHTCTPNGCEAILSLESKVLSTLESAKTTNVAFLDAVTRQQLTIGVSMAGFSDAYAALRLALAFQ